MSRVITVKVVDGDGYALSGYVVNEYGGSKQKTGKDGKVNLDIEGSEVTIYVAGSKAFSGWTKNCDNPLIVVK